MLSVTIANISPSQNTPVLPNMRRIVTRPSGASCSRRNSAKPSLATILNLSAFGSGEPFSLTPSSADRKRASAQRVDLSEGETAGDDRDRDAQPCHRLAG